MRNAKFVCLMALIGVLIVMLHLPKPVLAASAALVDEGPMPDFGGAVGWLNSEALNRTPCPQRLSVSPALAPPSARIAVVTSDLAAKACVPCRGGVPPLKGEELASLQRQVEGWDVIEGHHITKTFTFPNFRGALTFVNRVGELAEEQGHHPDISLAWGKVGITTWTHKINGLTESDFILAARIDELYKS